MKNTIVSENQKKLKNYSFFRLLCFSMFCFFKYLVDTHYFKSIAARFKRIYGIFTIFELFTLFN